MTSHTPPFEKPTSGLYIVATPIGNLKDITLRALEVLSTADLIAAEDTRVTAKLCARYAIKTKRISCHQHSPPEVIDKIVDKLKQGQTIALVSDAGTPLISDPGSALITKARTENIPICPIPGASSPIAAYSASGFENTDFYFAGFLPSKQKQRRDLLADLASSKALAHTPIIAFETPHRLEKSLTDIFEIFGECDIFSARELTKRFETLTLAKLSDYRQSTKDTTQKGEFVLIFKKCNNITKTPSLDSREFKHMAEEALKTQTLKDAAKALSITTSHKKADVYKALIDLKNNTSKTE